MTAKIPLKVVLPFLVIALVTVSLLQFGKPNVIILLQANNSRTSKQPVTSSSIRAEVGAKMEGAILSLIHPKNMSTHLVKISTAKSRVRENGPKMTNSKCHKNKNRLVFIKTHKTASTTVATLLERYGYERNLTFALPWATHIFHQSKLFKHEMVMTFSGMSKFNMLTNHARFDRKEMELVVPNAKYVTIIRNPVAQFESSFGYFEIAKHLGLGKKPNPLAVFLQNPQKYYKKNYHMKVQIYNGQIFDLGLNHKFHNDTKKVDEHISKLDHELDLVMLTEYFDESLILLRKLMCWNDSHILYLSKGVRNQKHRYRVTAEMADQIREWNAADQKLYLHFNRTFWQEVDDYGPGFGQDLNHFRMLQKKMSETCLDLSKKQAGDRRETGYALKKNAPDLCNDLVRNDIDYVRLIRWREFRKKFGLPKLIALFACGLVLLILILTTTMCIANKLVQWCCKQPKYKNKKCNYAGMKTNSI